jgi:hypothetical protein
MIKKQGLGDRVHGSWIRVQGRGGEQNDEFKNV